jgi:hypothetical protein
MEMTLNLTFEDGMRVVEAMKKVAIENGWDAEELDECGVIGEYSRAVDAALAAMGISVNIDGTPAHEDEEEDFDEDDFDFDFDDDEEDDGADTAVYSLTEKGKFVLQYMAGGYSFEEACEAADLLFGDGE